MKFRSRVRIAAADRGSRAGNAGSAGLARPGTADPAARAGHPGFPQATVRTHKRQGRFPSRRVIARRVLSAYVGAQDNLFAAHRAKPQRFWTSVADALRARRPVRRSYDP